MNASEIKDRALFIEIFNAFKAKSRDPDLESKIIQRGDPDAACLYAIHVVRGAWPAAEHVIGRACVYDYLTRFPEKEGYVETAPSSPSNEKIWLNDPIHLDPNKKDQWGRSNTRLIQRSSTSIMNAYLRLTKKRLPAFEESTKRKGVASVKAMHYSKLAYSITGEVVDFEHPSLTVRIIEKIKDGTYSKRQIPQAERDRLIEELERRITLYSFADSKKREGKTIKRYFRERVDAMKKIMDMLDQHDENMTIKQLKDILKESA